MVTATCAAIAMYPSRAIDPSGRLKGNGSTELRRNTWRFPAESTAVIESGYVNSPNAEPRARRPVGQSAYWRKKERA